jgi:Uma2 family endonuclease
MNQPQGRKGRRFTYADYRRWPADERWELIDGIAYAMGPAPLRWHQKVLGNIFHQVAAALEGANCEAYIAPFDVRLPGADHADAADTNEATDDALDTVVQPDLSVICDPAKLDDKGCRGAPDWIVEVLSPATASYDHITKRALYERAGVREFWLVHPTDHIATLYRQVAPERFGAAEIIDLSGHTAVSILPGVVIDWGRVTGTTEKA